MGTHKLPEVIFLNELIEQKHFDSEEQVYNLPESVLPRFKRNGRVARPLRFYVSDVQRIFSQPQPDATPVSDRSLKTELGKTARPSIKFKRRRRR